MPPDETTPCCNCGTETPNEELIISAAGDYFCGSCHAELFVHCDECDYVTHEADALRFDGSILCESCYDDLISNCEHCGEPTWRTAMQDTGEEYICRNCAKKIKFTDSPVFSANPFKRYVGIEIECIFPPNVDLEVMRQNLADIGKFKHDGSVGPQGGEEGEGIEFTLYPTNGDLLLERIEYVCRTLTTEYECFVNKTCGLHIHLDMQTATSEERRNVFEWWKVLQPIFLACVPEARAKNNFCYKLSYSSEYINSERYVAFNTSAFNKFGTNEIRLHQGSLSADKIIGWVMLHLSFFNTFMNITASSERIAKVHNMLPREQLIFLFQQCKLPLSMRKHIVKRIRKYASSVFTASLKYKPETEEISIYV